MVSTYDKASLSAKAATYCQNTNTLVTRQLGFGTQGMVFRTKRGTAIKTHHLKDGYLRERDVYKRLSERKIRSIQGLMIPRIKDWDDNLYIFEMSIVHVPCIIDFGGAYLDSAPGHMVRDEMWLEGKAEEFGENWDKAQSVIREIEYRADIWIADINTGNIKF